MNAPLAQLTRRFLVGSALIALLCSCLFNFFVKEYFVSVFLISFFPSFITWLIFILTKARATTSYVLLAFIMPFFIPLISSIALYFMSSDGETNVDPVIWLSMLFALPNIEAIAWLYIILALPCVGLGLAQAVLAAWSLPEKA